MAKFDVYVFCQITKIPVDIVDVFDGLTEQSLIIIIMETLFVFLNVQ